MDIMERIEVNFPELKVAMDQVPATFSLDWLKAAAMEEAGLDDFGPDSFVEPFDRLCASINEDADLNPYGRLLMAGVIRNHLVNRLLLQRERATNPGRLTQSLVPPIIVTGLPRTGTTFLHRVLAADPAHSSLPFWQLNRPIPRNADDTPDKRKEDVQAMLDIRLKVTPEVDGAHMMRAETPEECMWMTGTTGYTRTWWNFAPVYNFMRWYIPADKTAKYREYRELLGYLQGEYPGQRLVLKAPDHNDGLSELLDAIPEARIVITHRDPVEQIGSILSLGRTSRKLAVNQIDAQKEAEAIIDITDVSLQRMAQARTRHPGKILDVKYTDMMADPLGVVEQIYDIRGIALPAERREAIAAHHVNNPKGKHGKHEYSLAEFGLDNNWVRERYADYATTFLN